MLQLPTVSKFIAVFLLTFILGYTSISKNVVAQSLDPAIAQLESVINSQANLNIEDLEFDSMDFSSDNPSHLYLALYNQYFNKPVTRAIQGTAAVENLSESQVERYILYGDQAALDKTNGNQLELVRQTFASEKTLFQTLALLEIQTFAFELFSNGNLSDSSFDLVSDLETIENLLFAEVAPSQFGDLSQKPKTSASELSSSGFSSGFNLGPAIPPNTQTQSPDAGDSSPTPDLAVQSPDNACPIDLELENALREFEEQSSPNFGQTPAVQGQPSSGASFNPVTNSVASGLAPDFKSFTPINTKCQNAIAEFGNLFCLRLETITSTGGLVFNNEQHCVNCLIEKIAALSTDLNSESIVPRKITGKFGEPAFCKNQIFSGFSMNISFVPAPARPDLGIVDLIDEISLIPPVVTDDTKTNIEVTEKEIIERASDVIQQNITRVNESKALAEQILKDEQLNLSIEEQLQLPLQASTKFMKDIELRLSLLRQNFVSLREQLQQVQISFNQLNNKQACS